MRSPMNVTEGIRWILACTDQFDAMVAFFRDVMQLPVENEGVPVNDTQFTRYALVKMPNEVVLEIIQPREELRELYAGAVVSITVDDVPGARREMEEKGVEFMAPIIYTPEGWGWTYFRAPDGAVYQIQGPCERSA
jgi:predicted enzyme related to lactoylglutathione lyase